MFLIGTLKPYNTGFMVKTKLILVIVLLCQNLPFQECVGLEMCFHWQDLIKVERRVLELMPDVSDWELGTTYST